MPLVEGEALELIVAGPRAHDEELEALAGWDEQAPGRPQPADGVSVLADDPHLLPVQEELVEVVVRDVGDLPELGLAGTDREGGLIVPVDQVRDLLEIDAVDVDQIAVVPEADRLQRDRSALDVVELREVA